MPRPAAKSGTNARYLLRYRCKRCGICIKWVRGTCDECSTSAPLIQYHALLGAERFYQTLSPQLLFADAGTPRIPRVRGPYKKKSANASNRR